jgi:site-specific DNA-methyltransferase (adenine-specific)
MPRSFGTARDLAIAVRLGINGRLFFHDDYSGKTKQTILSVKAGKTGPNHVRDLRGVVERENAQIGVLISMQEPTQPRRSEAAEAGFYHSPTWADRPFPRIQLLHRPPSLPH